jgi:solute carrier family 34 (sodium-dependent phosphate cotransporter)
MRKKDFEYPVRLALVVFFVYLFLVSIGLMEIAFKGFGREFAESLIQSTSNPFVALFIGILATSIVQSSSTITSIVVGMVASGVLTIGHAVPIIMGANIGTTVTNTMVSLGHMGRRDEFRRAVSGSSLHDFFNIICVIILFPLEMSTGFLRNTAERMSAMFSNAGGLKFTSPLKAVTGPTVNFIKEIFTGLNMPGRIDYVLILIASLLILFLSLYFIVKLMKTVVAQRAEIVLNNVLEKSGFLALLAGFLFTVLVQSSSITTSLMVPLAAAGILTLEAIFPIVLGANLGTTTTAILASFATGSPAGITVAFIHLLFNVTGIVFIYPIKILRAIPIKLARAMGEMAYKKRRYMIIYVFTVFFIIPIILITISRFFCK